MRCLQNRAEARTVIHSKRQILVTTLVLRCYFYRIGSITDSRRWWFLVVMVGNNIYKLSASYRTYLEKHNVLIGYLIDR